MQAYFFKQVFGDKLFKTQLYRGFTLFEIVALLLIMICVFAFGAPKYIQCVQSTHNLNIDEMVSAIKMWSTEQAVQNVTNGNYPVYPLPSSIKIDNIFEKCDLNKWDDTDPNCWKYVAGGGIEITGNGSFLNVKPVYIN